MEQNALLLYMVIQSNSPKSARRREQLLRLEREALEARRRRRRERLRAAWKGLIALHGKATGSRRIGTPDLGQGLR